MNRPGVQHCVLAPVVAYKWLSCMVDKVVSEWSGGTTTQKLPSDRGQQCSLPLLFTEVGLLFFVSGILVVVLCFDYKWATLYTYPTGLISGIVHISGVSMGVQLRWWY